MPRSSKLPSPAPDPGLSPLEWQAVAIAAKSAKETRDAVPLGQKQAVDFTLRIRGEIDAADESSATSTERPALKELLSLVLLQLSPASRKSLIAKMVAASAAKKPPVVSDAVIKEAESLIERFTVRSRQPKRGAVSGRLTIRRAGRRPAA